VAAETPEREGVSRSVRYQATVDLIIEDRQQWRNDQVTLAMIERETDELASHAQQYLLLLLAWAKTPEAKQNPGLPVFSGTIKVGRAQRTAVSVLDADQR
jgi:hypothetical protein